ncbi:hypothetical protein BDW59DRAFT_167006 [Aspergillus cavernicola]|uniref:Xylanolytic transcriptional activator regulatory domain-containing protein n=1 Tax=Aspergillus cavernicola TaxID=176166 RepID=A0ABR4HHB4_9EURO
MNTLHINTDTLMETAEVLIRYIHRVRQKLSGNGRLMSLESAVTELWHGLKDASFAPSHLQPPLEPSAPSRIHHHRLYQSEDTRNARRDTSFLAGRVTNASPTDNSSHANLAKSYDMSIESWEAAVEMAKVYLRYCDCQPLPLFDRDSFISTFPNRPLEVVHGVLASVTRLTHETRGSSWPNTTFNAKRSKDTATRLVMSSITGGVVELSTLQTLCLLALVNFHDGDMTQCRMHGSLAMTFARSAQLHRGAHADPAGDDFNTQERRRCYWSIILLNRLIGEPVTSMVPTLSRHSLPPFPVSATSPPSAALSQEGQSVAASRAPDEKHGIVSVVIQLSEVWSMAQDYIRSRGVTPDTSRSLPPWHSSSLYFYTLEILMKQGGKLAHIHRYRFIRFSSVGSEELEEYRNYWGPWLLSRFLYHTVICILNHPILIILQLQGNRDVSEIFLQQTTYSRVQHTSWLLHFVEFLELRHFRVSDPMFGYCVAVLATIELYQSFVEERNAVSQKRKQNYEKCLSFIRGLGATWPNMLQAASNLECLMDTTTASYQSNLSSHNAGIVSVDISGFFRILDLAEFFSASDAPVVFGPTLSPISVEPDGSGCSDLAQLPHITQPDRRHAKSSPIPPPFDIGTRAEGSSIRPSVPELSQFQVDPSDDMLLQADQFFGSLYECTTPWGIMPDMMAGDMGFT